MCEITNNKVRNDATLCMEIIGVIIREEYTETDST